MELNGRTSTNITVIYKQNTFGSINATIANYGFPGIFRLHPGQSAEAAPVNADGTTIVLPIHWLAARRWLSGAPGSA